MIEFLLNALAGLIPIPKRWDGKNVSSKGTVRSAFRILSGSQPGLTDRWSTYSTAITDRHLWADRASVGVRSVALSARRTPSRREHWSLEPDFVVVAVKTIDGAKIEWGIRAGALDQALRLLGSIAVE